MITLSKDESMLLAIVKGWEHKEVPILRSNNGTVIEDKHEYIRRVCAHRCGCSIKFVDVWGIYAPLAEKLLTTRELIRSFEYCVEGYHTWTLTPIQALFSALILVKVQSNGVILVEMDMSEVKSMYEEKEK